MKQKLLLKTILLLCALVVGSGNVWADDAADWSYTVEDGDASKLNTDAKTFTVDASHVWNYDGTVGKGSPAVTIGSYSKVYGLKFGTSSSVYFSTVTLSTSAFENKAVTKVSLYLKHNGSKAGSLTVKQGSVTIGTATTSTTSDWIDVACSKTATGIGGTLTIEYSVAQALYINKIEVWYDDLGTKTTTTIDHSGISNTDIYVGTAAGSLVANVTETVGGDAVVGAAVTWSSSDEEVAVVASDGTVTLKKKGSATITALYAGNATYAGSSAEYVLTVTSSAPQATDIVVSTNYEWLGVSSGSNISVENLPKAIDCQGVTVTLENGGTSKPRGDDSYVRLYAGNILKFTAPTGYVITEIAFTKANEKWSNTFNVDAGAWNNETLKWTGFVNEVTLTEDGSSGNNQFSQMEITLVKTVDVTIGTYGWATFVSDQILNFKGSAVKAYIVTGHTDKVLNVTQMTGEVPANTPLLLNADAANTYAISVAASTTTVVSGNLLVAGTGAAVSAESGKTKYVLGVSGGKAAFMKISATAATVPEGKAYLQFNETIDAPFMNFFFDEDAQTTGVNDVRSKMEEGSKEYYNLNGQRVAQPTKGLYIVNGKKVLVK